MKKQKLDLEKRINKPVIIGELIQNFFKKHNQDFKPSKINNNVKPY
jgi:hypothetical protein